MNKQSNNYYRNLRKHSKGRRVKKREINWAAFAIITAIIAIIVAFIAIANSNSVYLRDNNQFTVEVGASSDDCEYDYKNTDLPFISKLCIPLFYKVSEDVNINCLGSYSIKYDSRLPFMTDYEHSVTVVDTTPPEISLEPLMQTVYQSTDEFVDPGYSAFDNYDGHVEVETELTQTRPYWYTIKYTATDSSGNVAEQWREINVIRGQVALTFDDGPSLNITPEILDILARNNIPATFFILGYNKEKENLVLQEFAEGHTIGYHGMSHKYSDIYSSLEALMNNFTSLEEDVIQLTGYSSKLVRFPGGSSNTVSKNYCKGIMSDAVVAVSTAGYTYFDWNVDSGDAGLADTAEEVYQNVISGIRAGRLNVVLMHDSASKAHTLGALEDIIKFCFDNDYEFVNLTSQSKQVTHKIAN